MGIKNIHITLIAVSVLLSVVFGFWCMNNAFQILGYVSLVAGAALAFYGVNFIKKARTL